MTEAARSQSKRAVIHRSRNMVHAEVVLAREDGQLVAKATATQAILRS